MRRSEKESITLWEIGKKDEAIRPTLPENMNVDVCIIGAGIAGLTIGYLLAKSGKDVVILDSWGIHHLLRWIA